MLFDHYKYYRQAREPRVLLNENVATGREPEAAEMAERERASQRRPPVERFRASGARKLRPK